MEVIVKEYGALEFLKRISDPHWFQAFGCVLGYDWHSSGVTTTVCGALKEALRDRSELGIFVAGGKGRVSRKTPDEIRDYGERYALSIELERLVYASRMTAKIDNTAVQDGYQLYHHSFVFTRRGEWTVVQQGMSEDGWARRYHWFSETTDDFVSEPHSGVCCDRRSECLNMVASESVEARKVCVDIVNDDPQLIAREFRKITGERRLSLPSSHYIPRASYFENALHRINQFEPQSFEELLGMEGTGPKTIRALALVAEVAYGAKPSYRDPARYSFAHGGKDGHPYPVDRKVYAHTIEFIRDALSKAKLGATDKMKAFQRLSTLFS